MSFLFFRDMADDAKPRSERQRIEAEIAALRARLWSDPGDRAELEGLIEQAEAELRALEAGEASGGKP